MSFISAMTIRSLGWTAKLLGTLTKGKQICLSAHKCPSTRLWSIMGNNYLGQVSKPIGVRSNMEAGFSMTSTKTKTKRRSNMKKYGKSSDKSIVSLKKSNTCLCTKRLCNRFRWEIGPLTLYMHMTYRVPWTQVSSKVYFRNYPSKQTRGKKLRIIIECWS